VNMWEHSVGLYHGANMSLLKTIMDVHLQLFKDRKSAASTVLLFVVRDFLGTTPSKNLTKTITGDLVRIWESIKKV
jgi:protein SEY1